MEKIRWTTSTRMAAGMVAGAVIGAMFGTEEMIALIAIGAAAGYVIGRKSGPT